MINRIVDEWLHAQKGANTATMEANESSPEEFSLPVDKWLEKTEKLVTSHPGVALAMAAGVGILLGWWVKRR